MKNDKLKIKSNGRGEASPVKEVRPPLEVGLLFLPAGRQVEKFRLFLLIFNSQFTIFKQSAYQQASFTILSHSYK